MNDCSVSSLAVPPRFTQQLTDYGLRFRFEDLPSDVRLIAKQCLLDWLGVTIAGWQENTTRILLSVLAEDEVGTSATLIGDGRKASIRSAAFVNGTASHVLDFDDVHPPSRVHPSAPVYPAALALGEKLHLPGKNVLAAFVAGVEVQSRIGLLMGQSHYAEGWVNTATIGTFGSAVASGLLLGLNPGQAEQLFGIAAVQAAGLRAALGTMCKPLQVGKAASNGLLSALLAKKGFCSRVDVLECNGGFVQTQSRRVERHVTCVPSDEFHTRGIIFKYHVSCFGTHAPIEAAKKIRDLPSFRLRDLERIKVEVEPQYLSVCNIQNPKDNIEAKFSLRHAVALALNAVDTGVVRTFDTDFLSDPKIVDTRNKIVVSGNDTLPRAASKVTVSLKDGAELSEVIHSNIPERDINVQWQRLEEKFRCLTEDKLHSAQIEKVVALVKDFENVPDVSHEMKLCWRIT